jgi:hypothetical protein
VWLQYALALLTAWASSTDSATKWMSRHSIELAYVLLIVRYHEVGFFKNSWKARRAFASIIADFCAAVSIRRAVSGLERLNKEAVGEGVCWRRYVETSGEGARQVIG